MYVMSLLLRPFAFFYRRWVRRVERKIGYGIRFTHIPEAWIGGVLAFDIERAWRAHGIEAWGVDYWTVGALVDGVSSRYLRDRKQYQSWLGAYLVKFKEHRPFTLQDHFDLAIADQKNWLRDFGDPHPTISMPADNVATPTDFPVSGYPGKLYEFLGDVSDSEVGSKDDNLYSRALMALAASLFEPRLKLRGSNFIPKEAPTEYETVTLKGYIAVIELAEDTKAVLYGNSATIRDADGTETDYFPQLKDDILAAFQGVEIERA